MKKSIVTRILLFCICMFLLLLTACNTPDGKQPEESKIAFSSLSDVSPADSSETVPSSEKSRAMTESEKTKSSKTVSSKSSEKSSNQNSNSFSSSTHSASIESEETESSVLSANQNNEIESGLQINYNEDLDGEWAD